MYGIHVLKIAYFYYRYIQVAELVRELRLELDLLLTDKIQNPHMDLCTCPKGSKIIDTIVKLISTQWCRVVSSVALWCSVMPCAAQWWSVLSIDVVSIDVVLYLMMQLGTLWYNVIVNDALWCSVMLCGSTWCNPMFNDTVISGGTLCNNCDLQHFYVIFRQ